MNKELEDIDNRNRENIAGAIILLLFVALIALSNDKNNTNVTKING